MRRRGDGSLNRMDERTHGLEEAVQENVPLAPYTWYKIGGPARYFVQPRKTEELQEGYAFRLPGDGERIRLIAELIVAERECCHFLTFEVSALPNIGPVIVRVIGPAGTKEFLRSAWKVQHKRPSPEALDSGL